MQSTPDPGYTSWWPKTEKLETLLNLKYSKFSKLENIGDSIKQQVKSKFESFWLKQIKRISLHTDGHDKNKMRFYKKIKGCLKKEAYIDLVPNQAQRSDLTRLFLLSCQTFSLKRNCFLAKLCNLISY